LRLAEFPLLADENIHPGVIAFLRGEGIDTVSVAALSPVGVDDSNVLQAAFATQRVVLTHDSDFGRLAIAAGEPFREIVYIRPGHIRAEYTIQTLRALLSSDLNLTEPFLLVAVRCVNTVRIRVRHLS